MINAMLLLCHVVSCYVTVKSCYVMLCHRYVLSCCVELQLCHAMLCYRHVIMSCYITIKSRQVMFVTVMPYYVKIGHDIIAKSCHAMLYRHYV